MNFRPILTLNGLIKWCVVLTHLHVRIHHPHTHTQQLVVDNSVSHANGISEDTLGGLEMAGDPDNRSTKIGYRMILLMCTRVVAVVTRLVSLGVFGFARAF